MFQVVYMQLVTLIEMSTNNPSLKSVFLESSVKPSLGCQFDSPGLVWQEIQEPLTQGAKLVGMV